MIGSRRIGRIVFGLGLGVAVGSCGPRHVRPDELSADGHRREAARESQLAEGDRARYDPYARESSPIQVRNLPTVGEHNPTDRYLRQAAAHDAHAREHAQAAAELERFEDQACAPLTAAMRAACPVLGPLAGIDDIDGGVRVRPADGDAVEPLYLRMRCHLAYARARGFEQAPDCPLYLRGVEIRRSADGRALELIAADGRTADELRRRARLEGGR